MSQTNEKSKNQSSSPDNLDARQPENQQERWFKYGANVLVSSIVVILLAGLVTYLFETHSREFDTTVGGFQSLRPQTVEFIQNLKTKVHIVALYPKLKSERVGQDLYQPVADLLGDYASKGQNITTEIIDPDSEKSRFSELVERVTSRYGGEVKGYKQILDDEKPDSQKISKFASDEAEMFLKLRPALEKIPDSSQFAVVLPLVYQTLARIPSLLSDMQEDVDTYMAKEIPSPKDAVDKVMEAYSQVGARLDGVNGAFGVAKLDKDVPDEIKAYIPGAMERIAANQKIVTAMTDRINKLGPLTELNEFRDKLKSRSILVTADNGYKILQFEDIWRTPSSSRLGGRSDLAPRMTFTGEQAIDASIASLTQTKKQMVVFVAPNADAMLAQDFSAVAGRLRDYNFDVQTKDTAGSNPMEGPPPSELTDEQLKSAIWVVLRVPDNPQMPDTGKLDSMLQKHLQEGGSAMILMVASSDPMREILSPFGIEAKADFVMAHDKPSQENRTPNDRASELVQQNQVVFLLNKYGNHPLAVPLQGLDFLTALSCPIQVSPTLPSGVTASPLLMFPTSPHSWAADGASMIVQQQQRPEVLTFKPKADASAGRPNGDIENTAASPLYGAAAAEKSGGGRVVVVGTFIFMRDDLVNLPDETREGSVARVPGNGEFFTDSIFWLAHMDTMLSISPHALEVARIKDMSNASLAFWRYGVIEIFLPLAVIGCGLMVYIRRRD